MSTFNKVLTITLLAVLLGAAGLLAYIIASPKVAEEFTEFYILDYLGKTQLYPDEFTIESGKVVEVKYDSEVHKAAYGRVILGITNHENEQVDYIIKVVSDNTALPLYFEGEQLELIGPVTLAPGEKWEQEIGFSPEKIGDRQKVMFVLYKDETPYFQEPPHLWIDVKER
ncbi:DUF1616 domain-containing protein [Chloroflexota bacterium]